MSIGLVMICVGLWIGGHTIAGPKWGQQLAEIVAGTAPEFAPTRKPGEQIDRPTTDGAIESVMPDVGVPNDNGLGGNDNGTAVSPNRGALLP